MLRLVGAACIIMASLGGFAQLRGALQKRAMELLGWLGAVRLLQSEMSWGLTPLPRLCQVISRQIGGLVGDFWKRLGDELAKSGAGTVPELTSQLLAEAQGEWHLLATDWQILQEMGEGLGGSGLAEQQRLLALTEQRLQAASDEAAARYARHGRLLGGLGWCCGLLLVCLWL